MNKTRFALLLSVVLSLTSPAAFGAGLALAPRSVEAPAPPPPTPVIESLAPRFGARVTVKGAARSLAPVERWSPYPDTGRIVEVRNPERPTFVVLLDKPVLLRAAVGNKSNVVDRLPLSVDEFDVIAPPQ